MPSENDIRRISLLANLLSQLRTYYPMATRMCQSLAELLRKTSLAPIAAYFYPHNTAAVSLYPGPIVGDSPWTVRSSSIDCPQSEPIINF